jgi:hypothetical protein
MFRVSRLAILLTAFCALQAAPPPPSTSQAQAALAQLPLRFEQNSGQAAPSVRFTGHAGRYSLQLTTRGPSFAVGSDHVDLSLLNSKRSPKIEGLDLLPARTNYFLGDRSHWRTNVPTYSRVRYDQVYRGIDVVYYGRQNQLEYDFILSPGADPAAIRMKFDGARSLSISNSGDLIVKTHSSELVQKLPAIYQDGHPIRGRYTLLSKNTVGVQVERYDRARPLVIDPVVTYTSYLGGTGVDQINAVKLGPNGQLYVAGQTATQDLICYGYCYNPLSAGLQDAFLAIFDTTQSPIALTYFSYLGGTNNDAAKAIDVDANGVVYLTGTTNSTDFPVTGNALQPTGAATTADAFVAVINVPIGNTDSLTYSTYLGGTDGDESGNAIVAGPNGAIYVIGDTKSTNFPVTGSAFLNVKFGSQDAFITKIDPSGALSYSTYMGGEGIDWGRAIAVGKDGSIYFALSTLSQQFPTTGGAYQPVPAGGQDALIGQIDTTKSGVDSLVHASYLGGTSNEEVHAMVLDADGNMVITGYTLSPDFPVTGDAMQRQNNGNADAFIAVVNLSANGSAGLLYGTYLGGSHGDVPLGVQVDSLGNIYVTGYTLSPDFPVTGDAVQGSWGQGINVFITKFRRGISGSGALLYSTYFGATGTYVPVGIGVGSDGSIYVAGYATSGLPMVGGAFQGSYGGGGSDGFVVAIGH